MALVSGLYQVSRRLTSSSPMSSSTSLMVASSCSILQLYRQLPGLLSKHTVHWHFLGHYGLEVFLFLVPRHCTVSRCNPLVNWQIWRGFGRYRIRLLDSWYAGYEWHPLRYGGT
jgi:hypothetical protein